MNSSIVVFALIFVTCFVHAENDTENSVKVITSDSQVEGMDKLKALPPVLEDAVTEAGMHPDLVNVVWERYVESTKATNQLDEPEVIKSITVPISTGPNQESNIIEVAINYGVTLTFNDPNGKSVFIDRYKLGNEKLFHIDDGNDGGGSNGSDSEKSVTSYLTITNELRVGATNLHVWLMPPDGSKADNNALSFYLKIVRAPDEYVDRVNFVVVDPSQQYEKNKIEVNSLDSLTLALNNRKPTPDAERVEFNGGVSGWKSGKTMWIRTAERLVFPSFAPDAALSSDYEHGINVYKVAAHPFIHVVDKQGRLKMLKLVESSL